VAICPGNRSYSATYMDYSNVFSPFCSSADEPVSIPFTNVSLGRLDGFDRDERCCESDEGAEVGRGLLAPQGDTLEAFQLADHLLDAGAAPVEDLREPGGDRPATLAIRDDRHRATVAGHRAVGVAVIALVAGHRTGRGSSGPASIRAANMGLSEASPPVSSKARGKP
jgi:hypothetical protein